MLQRLIGENVHLAWRPKADLWPVKMDPSQVDQILVNLCVNAKDAIDGTGGIIIEVANEIVGEDSAVSFPDAVPGEYVTLAVSDSGRGMDRETMDRIFEPFYTTKAVGQGTGLGLATVYGAVKQNNGFVHVYSEPGLGAMFVVHLPRHKSDAKPTGVGGLPTPALRGQETILLVEDEAAILDLTKVMLERQGYTVLAAINLLMTDVVMPEMNGRDLARNLLGLYPHLKRLYMSGYTANVIAHHGVLDEGVNFIQKPFSRRVLAEKVREALARP
jgi:CheY-like chemotaxis protein